MTRKVLIVGAKEGSLGEAIAQNNELKGRFEVTTGGLEEEGPEDWRLDITWPYPALVHRLLDQINPDHIVCTAGINLPSSIFQQCTSDLWKQMEVNFIGIINLLTCFTRRAYLDSHFIAISSNSAHIARSDSIGYCASKAALSMGLRCAARELDKAEFGPIVYSYEFGLLEGTPMTQEVANRVATASAVGTSTSLTRMVGLPNGIPVKVAAQHVVNSLIYGGRELNGTSIRIDNGEQ